MTFRTLVWPAALLVLSAVPAFGQSEQSAAGLSPWTTGTTIYQPFAQAGAISHLKGFSVVLVEGDIRGAAPNDSVPAAAAKALADLKDFLPYKSYRLIDTQWTLGSNRVSSRLRGPDGQEYDLTLSTAGASFFLASATGGDSPGRSTAPKDGVVVSNFVLRHAGAVPDRTAALMSRGLVSPSSPEGRAARDASLIDTSFRMDIGETVVVGTSRLQGDKALIVLLTAVGK